MITGDEDGALMTSGRGDDPVRRIAVEVAREASGCRAHGGLLIRFPLLLQGPDDVPDHRDGPPHAAKHISRAGLGDGNELRDRPTAPGDDWRPRGTRAPSPWTGPSRALGSRQRRADQCSADTCVNVNAGYYNTIGVRTDGTLDYWGSGSQGIRPLTRGGVCSGFRTGGGPTRGGTTCTSPPAPRSASTCRSPPLADRTRPPADRPGWPAPRLAPHVRESDRLGMSRISIPLTTRRN